jgi:glucose/arabinose dehydrogenase
MSSRSSLYLVAIPTFVLGLPILALACGGDDDAPAPGGTSGNVGSTSSGGTSGATSGGTSSGDDPAIPSTDVDPCRSGVPVTEAQHYVPPGMCARMVAVKDLRQIMFAPNGDLFGSNGSQIYLFRDADGDGSYAANEITTWATVNGTIGNNPWIDDKNGFIYIGSGQGVVRFPYNPAEAVAGGPAQPVVTGQPAGGHAWRTVKIYDGWIYVDSGSAGNATNDTSQTAYDTKRSIIKRFELAKFVAGTPFTWDSGEAVSMGLRNPNGFTRNEKTKKMYAVVNGLDNIDYKGQDVHMDNPGEQIVEVAPGKNYGYPFCFTAQRVVDQGNVIAPGTQLVNVNIDAFTNPHDDAWCGTNSLKPTAFVQAHSAPLDIAFFDLQPKGALDEKYRGGAFVALHGSWNRGGDDSSPTQTGYKVVWQPFNADGTAPQPTSTMTETTWPYEVVFGGGAVGGQPDDGFWNWAGPNNQGEQRVRPTGVAVSPLDGALYIATDKRLYRVGKKKQ